MPRFSRATFIQAGVVTGVAAALARDAAPTRASKRTKRIKTKRCRPQVDECLIALTAACNEDPTCLGNLVCCDLFATCDAAGAVNCIFRNAN